MKTILLATATVLFAGNAALALTSDAIIDSLSAQGFTRIDVRSGPTQFKVEAIRGTTKVETVFDKVTGEILDQEVETVSFFENTSPGVRVRERDRDFVGRDDDADRNDEDDRNDEEDDLEDDGDDRDHDGDDRDEGDDDRSNGDDDRDDGSDDRGGDDRDDGGNDSDAGDRGGDGRGGDDGDDD